jgi:hypothetical protein
MTLKVTTPMRGNVDGISLDQFEVGRVYEVCTELACYLLAMGSAVPADGEVPESARLPAEKRMFGPRAIGWSSFRPGLAARRPSSETPRLPAAPRKRSKR